MKKSNIILTSIIILGFILRLINIGNNPPSLNWDEAAWGYNAYSLSVDGHDEFGRFLPINYLESFGDFKPPVYAYLDILPIKLFGLNEFATRFPSALLGGLTILVVYFLVLRLFANYKNKQQLAIITAFLLAISPWHINLSRAAYEANVATFFIVMAVWSFIAGVSENRSSRRSFLYLLLSVISFVVSLYTFNTPRIVSPILGILLVVYFHKELLSRKKQALIAGILGFLILMPTIPFLLSPQASLRFKEVNIFSDLSVIRRTNQQIENDNNAIWSKVLHNRRLAYSVEYLKHYFDNLNGRFLFIDGDENPRFGTRDVGLLYLWELPFFIIGIFALIRQKEKNWLLVPLWLLIGILPAATARETPHALRIETTLPTFQILSAYGILQVYHILEKLKNRKIRFAILGLAGVIIVCNFFYYLYGYYSHYSREYSQEWQYGYKEAFLYTHSVEGEYDQIVFTTKLGRPYIFHLFYNKISPHYFRKYSKVQRDAFGFVKVEKVGKYNFLDSIRAGNINGKVLRIGTREELPKHAKIVKTFNLVDGSPVLYAFVL